MIPYVLDWLDEEHSLIVETPYLYYVLPGARRRQMSDDDANIKIYSRASAT